MGRETPPLFERWNAFSRVTVHADAKTFSARVRIDTPMETEYYRHGGILQYVLRQLARA